MEVFTELTNPRPTEGMERMAASLFLLWKILGGKKRNIARWQEVSSFVFLGIEIVLPLKGELTAVICLVELLK